MKENKIESMKIMKINKCSSFYLATREVGTKSARQRNQDLPRKTGGNAPLNDAASERQKENPNEISLGRSGSVERNVGGGNTEIQVMQKPKTEKHPMEGCQVGNLR